MRVKTTLRLVKPLEMRRREQLSLHRFTIMERGRRCPSYRSVYGTRYNMDTLSTGLSTGNWQIKRSYRKHRILVYEYANGGLQADGSDHSGLNFETSTVLAILWVWPPISSPGAAISSGRLYQKFSHQGRDVKDSGHVQHGVV